MSVSACVFENDIGHTYFLVDEVLVIILDVEFALHLLYLSTLQEELALHRKHFLPSNFTLAHQCDQLPGILELFTKPS